MAKSRPRHPHMGEAIRKRGSNGGSNYGEAGSSKGLMHGSPMAWVSAILAIMGLVGTVGQYFTTYAETRAAITAQGTKLETVERQLRNEIERNERQSKLELERNAKEDDRRAEMSTKGIERLSTQLDGMTKLYTKIEVLEVQLGNINETLKRIERQSAGKVSNAK